ncbi:MAG: pilus assembly protein PilM [Sedimentisphaerales bacterium]|nr:pilus assembly protein PilM [Sedimentisphaerales bacterium]
MKVKRAIGIDIGSSYLCAVQILRIGKAFCIEKIFKMQIRRSTDSPSDILKTKLREHGFRRRLPVAVSMPNEAVFFRRLETDYAGLDKIRADGPFALEYDFPIDPNETVGQVYSYRRMTAEKYSVLTAAVAKESLTDRYDILRGAKIRPDLIDTTVSAIHSTVAQNHPEIRTGTALIVHIAQSYLTLTVVQDNSIVMVRHLPILEASVENVNSGLQRIVDVLSLEAGIIWRKLFDSGLDRETRMYLVASVDNPADLKAAIEENLQCQTIVVNPYGKILLKHLYRVPSDISIAEGLALRILAPERTTGINLLDAGNANMRPAVNVKKEFTMCAVLVVAICIVAMIGLFARLSHLENQYADVKNQMNDVFRRTLPEEKNIVNPLAQLEQQLKALQKEYTLLSSISEEGSPLEVLRAITTITPSELKIRLDDVLVTAESIRLEGTTESFESVYNWQNLLGNALHFSTVDVRDVRRESNSEMVHFVVQASFASEKLI